MNNTKEALHGFWSDKQAKLGGYAVYTTPDGRQVKCSCVSLTTNSGCSWDDIRYVGKVLQCVKSVNERGKVIFEKGATPKVQYETSIHTVSMFDVVSFPTLTTYTIGQA
jgi:hypothetical protein